MSHEGIFYLFYAFFLLKLLLIYKNLYIVFPYILFKIYYIYRRSVFNIRGRALISIESVDMRIDTSWCLPVSRFSSIFRPTLRIKTMDIYCIFLYQKFYIDILFLQSANGHSQINSCIVINDYKLSINTYV